MIEIGRPVRVPLREVVAFEHPRDGVRGREPQDRLHVHRLEPLGVVPDLDPLVRQDRRNCSRSRSAYADDLLLQSRPRLGLAGRVADPSGEVADDQDRDVPGVLELPQLAEHDGPSERDVGRGRVEAELHAQRPAERELLLEPALGNDLGGPVHQQGEGVRSHGDRMLPVRTGPRVDSHDEEEPGTRPRRRRVRDHRVSVRRAAAAVRLPRTAIPLAQTSFLYASDGSLITELHAGEDRVVLSRTQMPQAIRDAVVAIEDKRFYYHHGFDLRAIIRAAYADVAAGQIVEGGSTITQQLVKQLYVGDDETFRRKIDEAVLAWQLEDRLTKDQILTKYLNTVYFGQGAYGIQAAARSYFGVDAKDLTLSQSALLAGLIGAPNDFDPFAHPVHAGCAATRCCGRCSTRG